MKFVSTSKNNHLIFYEKDQILCPWIFFKYSFWPDFLIFTLAYSGFFSNQIQIFFFQLHPAFFLFYPIVHPSFCNHPPSSYLFISNLILCFGLKQKNAKFVKNHNVFTVRCTIKFITSREWRKISIQICDNK